MIAELTTIRMGTSDEVPRGDTRMVRFAQCPCCDGRGWFLFNPFATGGSNGAGGFRNLRQCLTCADAEAFWNKHGRVPFEALALIRAYLEQKRSAAKTSKRRRGAKA